jgi:hypothetical protein
MVAVAMSNYRPQDSAIENLAHITTILEYKELPNIAKAAMLDDTMTPAYSLSAGPVRSRMDQTFNVLFALYLQHFFLDWMLDISLIGATLLTLYCAQTS